MSSKEEVKQATASTLRTWRKSAGYSQTAAAALVGTSQANISRWENGTVTPSSTELLMLAAAYNEPLTGLSAAIDQAKSFLSKEE
jgi:transcriptional regulator with XRE-family HTH domain